MKRVMMRRLDSKGVVFVILILGMSVSAQTQDSSMTATPSLRQLLDTTRDPQAGDAVIQESDLNPMQLAEAQKSTAEIIKKNVTAILVNPFKGNDALVDAVKAITRYHTGGGKHPLGIKVDI